MALRAAQTALHPPARRRVRVVVSPIWEESSGEILKGLAHYERDCIPWQIDRESPGAFNNTAVGHLGAEHVIDYGFRRFEFCRFGNERGPRAHRDGFCDAD